MTDKQIIIDGVDVSGCPYYIHKDGSCSSHDCECVKCVHNVCFYKDYKAKEQECKELKENLPNAITRLMGELDQLKAERDELKKQACGLRPELKYIIDKTCSKYNINSKYYHEKIVEIINNLDKLKQTLTEIKEIAEKAAKCLYTTESDDYTDGYRWLGSLILQKIRKCEVENERILSGE